MTGVATMRLCVDSRVLEGEGVRLIPLHRSKSHILSSHLFTLLFSMILFVILF